MRAGAVSIAGLRSELGLTLAEMGNKIGLSKSQMHEVERSGKASLRVAIALEALSQQRLDAADLSEDVKRARHGVLDTASQHDASTGNQDDMSGQEAA